MTADEPKHVTGHVPTSVNVCVRGSPSTYSTPGAPPAGRVLTPSVCGDPRVTRRQRSPPGAAPFSPSGTDPGAAPRGRRPTAAVCSTSPRPREGDTGGSSCGTELGAAGAPRQPMLGRESGKRRRAARHRAPHHPEQGAPGWGWGPGLCGPGSGARPPGVSRSSPPRTVLRALLVGPRYHLALQTLQCAKPAPHAANGAGTHSCMTRYK